jgi:hypothetical protein
MQFLPHRNLLLEHWQRRMIVHFTPSLKLQSERVLDEKCRAIG